ncbi:hypothetical protein [Streptomyces sp. NPDC004680]|uniref:hypothetical protein n=1 Tax=Streptomyces sp. NPDC004680 TaxID=3154287 RepID=UPI0033BEAE40
MVDDFGQGLRPHIGADLGILLGGGILATVQFRRGLSSLGEPGTYGCRRKSRSFELSRR